MRISHPCPSILPLGRGGLAGYVHAKTRRLSCQDRAVDARLKHEQGQGLPESSTAGGRVLNVQRLTEGSDDKSSECRDT
jgi:hypothetical protein